jgi:hypothetical protein
MLENNQPVSGMIDLNAQPRHMLFQLHTISIASCYYTIVAGQGSRCEGGGGGSRGRGDERGRTRRGGARGGGQHGWGRIGRGELNGCIMHRVHTSLF